jgi:peptidoglycan-associated lipoprotein
VDAPPFQQSPSRLATTSTRLAILAVVAATMLPVESFAQPLERQSRERLLGTITTAEPIGTRRLRAAGEMLADSLHALDRGDVMLARQLLATLIEQYPETRAGHAGKRELDALDREHDAAIASASQRQGWKWPASRQPSPSSGEPAGRSSSPVEATVAAKSEGQHDVAGSTPVAFEATGNERAQQLREDRRIAGLAHDLTSTIGDRVFFSEGSAELGARARALLAAQARWLARYPELPVIIEAHADDAGGRDFVVRIAERRGLAVQERLIEEGVAGDRISVQSFGRDRPIATCNSPACSAQNRRAVLRIAPASPVRANAQRTSGFDALATAPRRDLRNRGD